MDNSLLSMAFEHLKHELENQKTENAALRARVAEIESRIDTFGDTTKAATPMQDELLDTKQVLKILGVCYNTLQAIINKGLIFPIRINQRRIRFSREAINAYIKGQVVTPAVSGNPLCS